MRNYIYFVLLMIFSVSCNSDDTPEDIMSQRKLSNMLYEMTLIYHIKNYNSTVLVDNGLRPKEYLLKKYSVDSLDFVKSIDYYSRRPKMMSEIYKTILRKLNKKEDLFDRVDKEKSQKP